MESNIYKKFRSVEKVALNQKSITKRFDEPTYFSFRLSFGQGYDDKYNVANDTASLDAMPHPLFDTAVQRIRNFNPQTANLLPYTFRDEEKSYSALRYLVEANEPTRAEMLRDFIERFNELQNDYQYYFQAIDGVSELLKVDPIKGQRITNDKKLVITCLEAVDLRMSYLMNLYKKIVWDDIYQRWVLPDMMRYFTLSIYLTEFRTFHLPVFNGNTFSYGESPRGIDYEYLRVMDDILPVWEIACEMCEFDLSDISFEHLNGLNVASEPIQGALKFGVKVGNIKEIQYYPVFQHMYLNDKKLNNITRSQDEISTTEFRDTTYKSNYKTSLVIAQKGSYDESYNNHKSGLPFNERANQDNTDEAKVDYGTINVDINREDNMRPETWVGNAITTGSAFLKNTVNKIVDKAKVTPIPGLGSSFNEIKTAIESKDIVSALGMVRKSMTQLVNDYVMPSERLSRDIIIDNEFKQFLQALKSYTVSDATDDTTIKLQSAASVALSDRGIWEQIRDYSLATDLIGKGETNIKKDVNGIVQNSQLAASALLTKNLNNESIQQTTPNAASGTINPEITMIKGTASSNLSKILTSDSLKSEIASARLSSKTENSGIIQGKASEKLSTQTEESRLKNAIASERLSSETEASGINSGKASSLLSSQTLTLGLNSGAASEKLSSKTNITNIDEEKTSKRLSSEKITSGIKQGAASSNLSNKVSSEISQPKSSSILSSSIKESGINTKSGDQGMKPIDKNTRLKNEEPNIRTKTISITQIIEAEPTTSMNKKLDQEILKQPDAGKATTSKLDNSEIIDNTKNKSKSTNQELFSK